MSEIRFPEFRDQYEPTRYPFMDGASLTSITGQQLAKELFLDASIYLIGATNNWVYIAEISVMPREVTITIADAFRERSAVTVFDPLAATDTIAFTDTYGRPAGLLVSTVDKLAQFAAWPVGQHAFNDTATQFVPSCVIPTPETGVRGIAVETGEVFTGDVTIVGENGVVVRQDGENVIRVDIVGDPLFRRKLCAPVNAFAAPRFIRTINGCPADKYGNYNLTVGSNISDATILRVYKGENGLVIEAVGKTV